MSHENHIKVITPSRVIANSSSGRGKSSPAVPVLQQKQNDVIDVLQKKEESDMPQDHYSNNGSSVIQKKPSDWKNNRHASGLKIAEVQQHQPGYFSTWKKILATINEYKELQVQAYGGRSQKLDRMETLIAEWIEDHKTDTTERVQGIRVILPDLEELISNEREEIKFAFDTIQYTTGNGRYKSKTNAAVAFTVVKHGELLNIVSDNLDVNGYIKYVLVDNTIQLNHFEAQPEGLGLGSVLLNEFAAFASTVGVQTVDVQMPALSAMGAYEVFGGIPQADYKDAFENRKGQYENAMGLRKSEEAGEYIAGDHDDNTYDNFISEEAKAVGNTKANKAKFENKDLTKEDMEQIKNEAINKHKETNLRDVDNVKRVARLKALSGFLSYNINALLNKTAGMVKAKWDME